MRRIKLRSSIPTEGGREARGREGGREGRKGEGGARSLSDGSCHMRRRIHACHQHTGCAGMPYEEEDTCMSPTHRLRRYAPRAHGRTNARRR
jgi:hypothetical protein